MILELNHLDRKTKSDIAQFAIFVVENAAERWGMTMLEAYSHLKASDAIESFICKFYQPLHSQNIEYVLDQVETYCKNRK